MKLATLLQSINITAKKNDISDLNIEKIAYHSGQVEPETLFVCIRGFETDGHKYAGMAIENGASALIVERFIGNINIPQFLVEDGRIALAEMSDVFYNHPSRKMRLFGVTGTNGKTTITYMTDAVFEANDLNTGMIGTIMVKFKDKKVPSVLTTPESLDLQKYFVEMQNKGVSHVSMEVSSSALDLKRTNNVAFDVAAFTNIHRDHIELHGSFEAYFNAKASFIRNAKPGTIALLNIDEPLLGKLIDETEAQMVSFGIKNNSGTFHVSDIDMSNGFPSFTVIQNHPVKSLTQKEIYLDPFEIQLSVPGYYSIYNALTAIITGLVNDIPLGTVKSGIENFKGVERRFEILYEKDFMVIDDLLLNEDNIEASMNTLKNLNYSNIHFVHAVRGNRGVEVNRENAEKMAEWLPLMDISKVTLTASRSHVGELDQVSEAEIEAFASVMKKEHISVDFHYELQDAIASVVKKIKPNDILFITGAHGMDHGSRITFEMLLKNKIGEDQEEMRRVLDALMNGIVQKNAVNVP